MDSVTSHFDGRSATYDRDAVHHRVASLLVAGADLSSGLHVLDIATGTGLVALEAARQIGPAGKVLGIDISHGMLAEARRKAAAAGLRNIDFTLADAERLDLPRESFDRVFCSSALVMMADARSALRHWFDLLKPGGIIAFDTPSRPFGMSQMAAEVAAAYGVHMAFADLADTPGKCRSLAEGAGLEVMAVRTELANSEPMELSKAIAFWDNRLEHPAWRALNQVESTAREAMRSSWMDRVTSKATAGYVPNDTALNFVIGRRPVDSRQPF